MQNIFINSNFNKDYIKITLKDILKITLIICKRLHKRKIT